MVEDELDDDYVTEEGEDEGAEDEEEEDGFEEDLEDDILIESVWDRVAALVDVVPPMARYRATKAAGAAATTAQNALWGLGKAAWVVATVAFLVALPVGLEYERESFALQQENQQRLQQAQAQVGAASSS
ncbi:hypothetical protein HK405_012875 [Cladochytrium tenue]|nr:hypothetical protein HK405_012875 [Cladochytrium tenue]